MLLRVECPIAVEYSVSLNGLFDVLEKAAYEIIPFDVDAEKWQDGWLVF